MRKILLIVSSKITGLNYYRQLMPHNHLVDSFDGFEVKQATCDVDNFMQIPDSLISEFDCVYFLRHISLKNNTKLYIDRCHRLGCKVFFDIDDYWRLPKWHPMALEYEKRSYPKQVEDALKYSDVITTTNVWLQNQIKKINKNVFVLPNSCDTSLPQYKRINITNRRTRFGWIGGIFHHRDIKLLSSDMYKFYKDEQCVSDGQICLGGYSNGQGEYKKIEEVLTNNYSLEKEYKNYLLKDTNSMSHVMFDKPYSRLYARDVNSYMRLYNEIDVALIPLEQNLFNTCKSELKMIEAGVMGKACITNEVSPYILSFTDRNSFKVNKKNTFYDGIKFFLNNKQAIKDYAYELEQTINERYNMEKINKTRAEIYNYYL